MSQNALVVAIVVSLTAIAGYGLIYWLKLKGHVEAKSEELRKAMNMNAQFMTEIEQYLKHRGVCDHIEKTGSTYEDLNVDEDAKIQLEALMIQPVSGLDIAAEKINENGDYACLRFLHGRKSNPTFDLVLKNILGSLVGARYLDLKMTADLFERELQNCIAESKQMKGKVKLIRSGPVLQMEVYQDSWMLSWGPRLYTVDLVPAYKIGEELYESRPRKGDKIPDTMTWHRTFALQERQKLCEGAKMVLRVLKDLRKRDSGFGNFTSYQLKTAVLHEMDTNQDWSELMLWKRVADVLARLEKCLAARNLSHYFLPEINLLSKMPPKTMDHLRDSIQRLNTNNIDLSAVIRMQSMTRSNDSEALGNDSEALPPMNAN